MTSISPWAHAATQVQSARQSMNRAATIAATFDGMTTPTEPTAVPEQGDHTTLPVGRPGLDPATSIASPIAPPLHPFAQARFAAIQGIAEIGSALKAGTSLAPEVVTALETAAAQATQGVSYIAYALRETPGSGSDLAPGAVTQRFQSSSLWLELASSLIALDHGPTVIEPPVVETPNLPIPIPANPVGSDLPSRPPVDVNPGMPRP